MNTKIIHSISKQIYRRFPEVNGARPKIRLQPSIQNKTNPNQPTYLLIYSAEVKTMDGKSIKRWVRVTIDRQGKILKVTTSK